MNRPLRVLLGVSGGIAAYKSAELVRRLRSRGHEVRCALTRSAVSFVTPLTLEVLTGHPVYQEEYLTATGTGEEAHITAAAWAEVLCVAPATANVLARLALGLGDDFLTTTALAFSGPVVVAPAMHSLMWERETTRQHVEALKRRGVWFAGPVEGPLASGEAGMGRMAEPEEIARLIESAVGTGPLAGRTVLVTAGPTHEPVDPVRFLGNRSSGRMGFALAAEAARRGARVVLVAGPVSLGTPHGVERIDVVTACEMEQAVRERAPGADMIVMSAAVADYRPSQPAGRKIKKEQGLPSIELEENPDILAGLRPVAPRAVIVGFAAETHDLEKNARAKLDRKGADFLVANDVSRRDIAFGSGENEVTVYRREGEPVFLSRRPKGELAASLFDLFAAKLSA
ncbi:MAG: bifunctional phosphopantothenoylcysteine decarboxylase/phosphopantothenate--cysteine ligase CoaBC [Thermoanaerobaculia bacterium]